MYYEEEFFQDEFDVGLRTEAFVAKTGDKSVAELASFHAAYDEFVLSLPEHVIPKHEFVSAIDKAFTHIHYKHMPTLIWAYYVINHHQKEINIDALNEVPVNKADVLRYARRFIFYL
ncbi:hypothetical protein [Scale drop disease virus]|uniref:ORF_119R n=1 Tax=Scale drop disease virus TaxID=1697349 RepID=A0A0K1L6M4_9VIRU|nr:ORF_119R [Scale drop disease virus]AKU37534.1 ORF_119R [Scale drop disease virus]QLI60655.1 hypothetical protein [Scale drop disease virus]QXJ13572.1 ORF119R [Scale drop disease virus]UNH60800.1 hypothetical protein SDDV_ORF131 [Scale drop disease virus]